mgnify:CR=1 FL=1
MACNKGGSINAASAATQNLNGGNALNAVTGNSFVQHVTRFDSETRSELTNLIQYLVIAVIPIYFLNRSINNVIPEFDEKKGNIELLGEVIIHTVSLILGIYLIHRVISYIPTFSGENHSEINFLNIVLMVLFVGMGSDNGKKVNHVYERIFESKKENMTGSAKTTKKDGSVVKVSQPLANGGGMKMAQATHQASRADYLGTHQQMTAPQPNQVVQEVHNNPNSQMAGGSTGMNNFGGMGGMGMEPMAANEGFGAFSSF